MANNPMFYDEKPKRALIIDDDEIFHSLIGDCFQMLSFEAMAVFNFEEAEKEIRKSIQNNVPFSIITIDNNFDKVSSVFKQGKHILTKLKLGREYAQLNLGCIMITATDRFSEREILDFRDKFGLDYFIKKDELDVETLKEGIKRASRPHKPAFNIDDLNEKSAEERRFNMLIELLNIYRDICITNDRNLGLLKQKKARQGGDLNIKIENEIKEYEENLREAEKKIFEIEKQLKEMQ